MARDRNIRGRIKNAKRITRGQPKPKEQSVYDWAMSQPGATESVKFDEDTGEPLTCISFPLK